MGNIDALRDWGHAKDYVRMQWMMLQQEAPEDFVIATGEQHSVRDFIRWSAAELGIELEFKGEGVTRSPRSKRRPNIAPAVKEGDVIVRVDPALFPARRGGDAAGRSDQGQGKTRLGARDHRAEMCAEMVEETSRSRGAMRF
jgi:GDPmannose 4,6-dehydratase